jgi:hypothetical protein
MKREFNVIIEKDEAGWFVATVPELNCWAPTVAVYDDLARVGLLQFKD